MTTLVLQVLGAVAIFAGIRWWVDRRIPRPAPPRRPAPGRREDRPPETIHALHAQGLLTPDAVADLTPRERAFYLDAVRAAEAAAEPEPHAAPPTPPQPIARPLPPAEVPLPMRLYCPACAAPLAERGQQSTTVTECHGCGRKLTVSVEGTQLVVRVELN